MICIHERLVIENKTSASQSVLRSKSFREKHLSKSFLEITTGHRFTELKIFHNTNVKMQEIDYPNYYKMRYLARAAQPFAKIVKSNSSLWHAVSLSLWRSRMRLTLPRGAHPRFLPLFDGMGASARWKQDFHEFHDGR